MFRLGGRGAEEDDIAPLAGALEIVHWGLESVMICNMSLIIDRLVT